MVPFLAVLVAGYLYHGVWAALGLLVVYVVVALPLLILVRSPRARWWTAPPPEIDTSDPRWRNLMP
jgi:hypothetical protein